MTLKMKTSLAILCIVLLACTAFCTSRVIKKCRCVNTSQWVNSSRITHIQEFGPSPYCNKRQVIVTLNDGTKRCLDPKSNFTKKLLQKKKNQLRSGHKMNP